MADMLCRIFNPEIASRVIDKNLNKTDCLLNVEETMLKKHLNCIALGCHYDILYYAKCIYITWKKIADFFWLSHFQCFADVCMISARIRKSEPSHDQSKPNWRDTYIAD